MTKIGADIGYRDLARDPLVLKDGSLLTDKRAAEWNLEIEQRLWPESARLSGDVDEAVGTSFSVDHQV